MSIFLTDEMLKEAEKARQQSSETLGESLARHKREILRQQRLKDQNQKIKREIKKHKREGKSTINKGTTKIHWTEYKRTK